MEIRTGINLACALMVLAAVSPARAQQVVSAASLTGTVIDANEAAVPGAVLQMLDRQSDQVLTVTADERGRFRFLTRVGEYQLLAHAPGFATTRLDLTLRVGAAVDLRVRLAVAAAESLTVSAEAPFIDTARTSLASTVTPSEIESLPLNGRNYLDLALLAPNVSRTTTRSSERFAETSAVPGTGLSVAGQRNLASTFIVDGLSANDDAADLAGTAFSEEVIREFQVVTTGGTAEFGRASSGIINIVTQSGGQSYRGGAYGFFRDARWDARNAFASRKDPLQQVQYGLSAGGPVLEGRTFFFANVERAEQERQGVVTIAPPHADAINRTLALGQHPGPRVDTGEFLTGYSSTNVFGRLDHTLAEGARLQVRYSRYAVDSPNARGVGGLSAVSRGTRLENRDQTLAGAWLVSFLGSGLNDLRLQWTDSELAAPANDTIGPALTISGVANAGAASSSPVGRDLSTFQIAETVAVQQGGHMLKVGIDALYNEVTIDFPGALQGSYSFTSLANFEQGIYQQYQQAFGETTLAQRNPNVGLFVQDEWRAGSALTLNAGVRYDLQWLPEPIEPDRNNVSPRLGAAWTAPDRDLVVRANAGVYFNPIPLRASSNALQRNGERYRVAVVSFGETGAPVFPQVLPEFPSHLVSAITTIDPRIQNGRSEQAGVEVERSVGGRVSLAAAYSYVRGHQIILSRNINVPTLTAAAAAAAGVPNLGRPNPAYANISRYESLGDSWFRGLTLSMRAQPAGWGSHRLAYTWSSALDTAGNAFFSSPQDSADIAAEKGPSDNDQRHRVVVSGALGGPAASGWPSLLRGVELGYVVSYATGVPFTILAGSDLNHDTNNNDRPPGVGRNTARQPATASIDLRLSRSFRVRGGHRLQALIEGFNLLNRVNVLVVNNTFGTAAVPLPAFGRPTSAAEPRQIQLGIRWSF